MAVFDVDKNFEVDNFEKYKSMFICCFDHLLDDTCFETKKCLHYYRGVGGGGGVRMERENSF